jgi:hypothetical protein
MAACAVIRIPLSVWSVCMERWLTETRHTKESFKKNVDGGNKSGGEERAVQSRTNPTVIRSIETVNQILKWSLVVPIQIGLVLATKRIAALPVLDLAQTSFAWLPSLAAPDPYYLLPALNMIALYKMTKHYSITVLMDEKEVKHHPRLFLVVPAVAWLAGQSGALNILALSYVGLVLLHQRTLASNTVRTVLGLSIRRQTPIEINSVEFSSRISPASRPIRAKRSIQSQVPNKKSQQTQIRYETESNNEALQEMMHEIRVLKDRRWVREEEKEQNTLWELHEAQQKANIRRMEIKRQGGRSLLSPMRLSDWLEDVAGTYMTRRHEEKDEECSQLLLQVEENVEARVKEGAPRKITPSEQLKVDLAIRWLIRRKAVRRKEEGREDSDDQETR